MSEKIIIIGGGGFIGRTLVSHLSNKGFELIAVGRNIKSKKAIRNVAFHSIDIHHTNELINLTENAAYVIWLVHASVPSTTDDSLVDDFLLNVAPVIRFLEKASKLHLLKKFIYLSSGGTIYGDNSQQSMIGESSELEPISSYGLSKLVIEKYIEFITKKSVFNTVVLRPSNVYGPFQNLLKPQGIIGYAFKALRENTDLQLYGGGAVVRDFIFVEDLVRAIESALFSTDNGKYKVYNVGSGEGIKIIDVLKKIEGIANKSIKISHMPSRSFDCMFNVLDISSIQKELSWTPDTNIDTGLNSVWEWIKEEY